MPTCPSGHDSASADFCDTCGMRIEGAPPASPAPLPAGDAAPAPETATCPQCGTARTGQFCEVCGYSFTSGQPLSGGSAASSSPAAAATSGGWTADVSADRAYYDSVIAGEGPDAGRLEFPGYCPERQFRLTGREVRIGRRSASRGLQPEIDLTGPPADPGVSHLHAVLIAEPDGSWVVLDPGSANGTRVNDADIPPNVRVPLHDGDRICLGAWTRLTIHAT